MKKTKPKTIQNPILRELERYREWPVGELNFAYDCGARQRVCNACKGPIMKGEPHFSHYVRYGKYNTRYNTCAFCATGSIDGAIKRLTRIKELLGQYMKENQEMVSRHEFMDTIGDMTKGLDNHYYLIKRKLYKIPKQARRSHANSKP